MILHCSSALTCDLNTVACDSLAVRWCRNKPLAISCCCQYTILCSSCREDFDLSIGCLEVAESDPMEFVRTTVNILEVEFDSHHLAVRTIIALHNYCASLGDFHEEQNSSYLVDRSEKVTTELRNDHYSSSAAALRLHVTNNHAVRFAA